HQEPGGHHDVRTPADGGREVRDVVARVVGLNGQDLDLQGLLRPVQTSQLRLVEALVVEAADVAHQGGLERRLRRLRLRADAAGEHHRQRAKRYERSQNSCRKSLLAQSPPPPTGKWPT